MDGGRSASAGFLYQYLRTVEAVLKALTDIRIAACRVEGDPTPGEVTDPDAVDFDLVDQQGAVVVAAQVKSSSSGQSLGAAQVWRILERLIQRPAQRYQLLTNTALTASARKLLQALEHSRQDPTHGKDQLHQTLTGAAAAGADRLDDRGWQRLARCQVLVDTRGQHDLAAALRHSLIQARRHLGLSLGQESAGLLLALLQAEVHARAADPDRAVWPIEQVRQMLQLDAVSMANTLGRRDWGHVLGLMAPVPDVARPDLLDQVQAALSPDRDASMQLRHCVLAGASGIGKSSLAAAHVAGHADAYQSIFWVDASTEQTLSAGYQAIATRLAGPDTHPTLDPRLAVHESLSVMAGRWLLVLDDATPACLDWLPRLGDGDILITTLDSAHPFGAAERIAVPSMQPDEAIRLLAARLGVQTDLNHPQDQNALAQLATRLEHWPLALELAAAYITGCGYSIADIPTYLDLLATRPLGDDSARPAGYPRSLVAAVLLCLELIRRNENDPSLIELTVVMLARGCYLNSRQIPVHLLAAPSAPELDQMPQNSGPAILEDPRAGEAIRALQRVSLVRRDDDLPAGRNDSPGACRTIMINTVVQTVIRTRSEEAGINADAAEDLTRLAMHTDVWLSTSTYNEEPQRAPLLCAHAEALLEHLQRLNINAPRIGVLLGNVAGVYRYRGETQATIRLLERQLDYYLELPRCNEFLPVQTRIFLATSLAQQADEESADACIRHIERCLPFIQSHALIDDEQNGVLNLCVQTLSVLDQLHINGIADSRCGALHDVITDVTSRLPSNWDLRAYTASREANIALSQDNPEYAERICRPLLDKDRYGTNKQHELHRLLLEALAQQHKWSQLDAELDLYSRRLGEQPLYTNSVEWALHNVGLCLAGPAAIGDHDAQAVFRHLMSLPAVEHVVARASGEYKPKFAIFQQLRATLGRDDPQVTSTATLSTEEWDALRTDPEIAANPAWTMLYELVASFSQRR